MEMEHEKDPRAVILDKAGDLSGVEVFGSDVLIGIYIPPTKTKSGIFLSDATVDEARWQGKAGLVLKMGSTAYCDENGDKFRDIKEGDTVTVTAYKSKDGSNTGAGREVTFPDKSKKFMGPVGR